MPDFLYAPIPFAEKVFKFNMYIRTIVRAEQPDIIAVGIPEGVVPFEQRELNNFAEYALVISTAITIDAAVLCTYFAHGEIIEEGIQTIMDFCEARFGLTVGAVNFARVLYEIPQAEIQPMIYEFLNDDYVSRNRTNFEDSILPLFDLYNREHAEKVILDMIAPFKDNVKAI